MKWGVATLIMAMVCVNFCSCSDDDGPEGNGDTEQGGNNGTSSSGTVVVSPSNVFLGLVPTSVMGASFFYNSDGRIEEIITEYGERLTFIYGSGLVSRATNPERTIQVVGEDFIFNMEVGDNGFVRYCEEVYLDDCDYDGDKDGEAEMDTWEFGYNSDGQLNYMKRSEGGNEVTNITYQNGNIVKVSMRSEEDGEGCDYSIGYTSDEHPVAIENKGCLMLFDETLGIDMDEMWYVYYAGLLGKPTKNLPVSLTDIDSEKPETETFSWQLNSAGYPVRMQAEGDIYHFEW